MKRKIDDNDDDENIIEDLIISNINYIINNNIDTDYQSKCNSYISLFPFKVNNYQLNNYVFSNIAYSLIELLDNSLILDINNEKINILYKFKEIEMSYYNEGYDTTIIIHFC